MYYLNIYSRNRAGTFLHFLQTLSKTLLVIVICNQKCMPSDVCGSYFYIWLAQTHFLEEKNLRIPKLYVICLKNVMVVILETHAKCHWLHKGLQIFSITKAITKLTSFVYTLHCNFETSEGDEIRRRSPKFVTLRKNEFSMPRQYPRSNWLWPLPRPLLYRLQYQKISWGNLKKVL